MKKIKLHQVAKSLHQLPNKKQDSIHAAAISIHANMQQQTVSPVATLCLIKQTNKNTQK
jgi:hypothetical protein